MTTLTPLVRAMLIVWAALWVVSTLAFYGGWSLADFLGLDVAGMKSGEATSFLGLFTYPFLHEPHSLLHLLFNCLLLYFFAPEVERMNPGRRMVRLLAIAALAGAGFRLLLSWMSAGFDGVVVGGSGLVACCFAFLAAVMPGIRVNLIFITVRLLPLFLVLTGLDALRLIGTLMGNSMGIAADVHLAGSLVGWTAAGGWERFPLFARWKAAASHRRQQKASHQQRDEEAELDRILAKISREGIGALTKSERSFLERRSQKK